MTKLLVIGGSGFVGRSLLTHKDIEKFDRVVITRSGLTAVSNEQHKLVAHQDLVWDVRRKSDLVPSFDVIIHAATPASALMNTMEPKAMQHVIVQGMENVIEFASRHSVPPKVLFTSSGAVYGEILSPFDYIFEDFPVGSESPGDSSPYAEGKRRAEIILRDATAEGLCNGIVTRLFAFSGTHLPRDRHFAIGNFVEGAVTKKKITVRSDGSSIRSYLDEQDMAQWLLAIAEKGLPDQIYHVGSERAISIRDLALLVSERCEIMTGESIPVEILGQVSQLDGVSHYVPSTLRTRSELGLSETITLESSIDRMLETALAAQS
jgi:nucleoside-diphosphate-sugar epimerase